MRFSILLAACLATMSAACAPPPPLAQRPAAPSPSPALALARAELRRADSDYVMVVAHRACWRDGAPENSLSAIDACLAIGADMVELDVRRTRDGVLVLMHDDTVDRTTNGSGNVAGLTFAEIRGLRLRAGDGGASAALTSERIPTFEEAMQAVRGRILVNLDAKADVYDDAFAILEKTGTTDHIIMKRTVTGDDDPLASIKPFDRVFAMPILMQASGSAADLVKVQARNPPIAYELIFDDFGYLRSGSPIIKAQRARVWVNTLAPHHAAGIIDAAAIAAPEKTWGLLLDLGVNMIQTDEPKLLIKFLKRRQRRGDAMW